MLRRVKTSHFKNGVREVWRQDVSGAPSHCFLRSVSLFLLAPPTPPRSPTPINSLPYTPIASRTVTEQKRKQGGISWGAPGLGDSAFVAEDRHCWTAEGAGVNYSITGWLSLELFKQVLARRGLGLITGCKSYGHDPFLDRLLLRVSQPFWGIFICEGWGARRWGGGRGV